ncbi:hypothetical protein BDZ94DRAFT_1268713, partial [Collybia nuda]
ILLDSRSRHPLLLLATMFVLWILRKAWYALTYISPGGENEAIHDRFPNHFDITDGILIILTLIIRCTASSIAT